MNAETAGTKVTVAVMTYNQAPYVRQALDSVLMQECDFAFDCIVSDDCSTDGTQAILEEYQRRFPDRIRLMLRDENVGSQRNLAGLLEACDGQYIAYLEGDDFWTSEHKLQRQVEFMDANPDCALSFHDRDVLYEEVPPAEETSQPQYPTRSGIEDLLKGNYISACTVMYRAGLVDELPAWWNDVWIGDLALHVLHAQHGWIGHIDETMATYRVHGGGLWSGKAMTSQVDAFVDVLRHMDKMLGGRYHDTIERSIFKNNYNAALILHRAGERRAARRFIRDCLRHWRMRGEMSWHDFWWLTFETGPSPLVTVWGRLREEYPWVLIVAPFITINVVWMKMDRLPPMWDQSWYLQGGEILYRGLVDDGLLGLIKAFTAVNPVKAPLLSLLPVPLYLLFGRGYGVALAVNLTLMAIGSYHLFHLVANARSRRAAWYAVALFNLFPLVMGLSREFLVETLLAVLVITWHRYLLESDLMRKGGPWRAGLILGLGMLTKILFPLYIVGGSLYALWRRVRADGRVTGALVWTVARIAAVGAAISALWYARNLQGALGAAAGSSFGSVASDYGARSVFAWETLSAYWLRVLEDGVSPILSLLLLLAALSVLYVRVTKRDAVRPPGSPRTEVSGIVLLWFLVPFVVLTLGVNKDVRFLLPAFPALAVAGSMAFARMTGHPVLRVVVSAGLVLALGASVLGSFVPSSATRELGVVLRSTVTAGAHGPLGSYMRAPSDDVWPLSELVGFMEADALQVGRIRPVAVVLFDHPYLNLNSIGYIRAFDGGNVEYQSAWYVIDSPDTADEIIAPERADYLIVKSGELGPDFANEMNRRVLAQMEDRPKLPFDVAYEKPLPDGSTLTVYRRMTGSGQ